MKQTNQSLEILEPDVEEIPLEEVINTTLVKANVTDAVIASLKQKYGNLRLDSLEDKENYLIIKDARKEVRKVGIITEKLCKKGREDAVIIQKKWLAKEKEILAKIDEVEAPLNNEIERFDNEVERKELEADRLRDITFIKRQSSLSKLGAIYNNGSFDLNHISYEIELIKQADNEMWEGIILPKYQKIYEEKEAEKVAEENKRKLEMEASKRQREEFELQQAQFKKEKEELENQKRELQKQKDDADREKRLEQERKEKEDRGKKQEIIDNRASRLISLGMNYDFKGKYYSFDNVKVPADTMLMPEQEWIETLDLVSKNIASIKLIQKQDKKIKEEQEAQAALTKALADAEFKKQQEEQRKAEELSKSGDKSQWQHFISILNGITFPEMKSGMYRSKIGIAKEKLEEIVNL